MQYGLVDEDEMIAETVRSFVENEIYPHEEVVERTGEVPPDVAQDITGNSRLLSVNWGAGRWR
jgi:acyl-CoA dehydrogenase